MIECSLGPSGVPSCTVPIHSRYCASSLMGEKRRPAHATVGRAEQPLRRGAGVPDVGLAGVTRREPERVVDRAAPCRRPPWRMPAAVAASFQLRPRLVERNTVGPEVPGLGRRQQRLAVARVEHDMVDDVAEEMRAVGAPGLALRVAVEEPGALARRDEHDRASGGGRFLAVACHRCLRRLDAVGGSNHRHGAAAVCYARAATSSPQPLSRASCPAATARSAARSSPAPCTTIISST